MKTGPKPRLRAFSLLIDRPSRNARYHHERVLMTRRVTGSVRVELALAGAEGVVGDGRLLVEVARGGSPLGNGPQHARPPQQEVEGERAVLLVVEIAESGSDVQHGRHRGHFLALAAQAMRRIMIDHARTKGRAKRGSGQIALPLDLVELATRENPEEIAAVNEAICRLERTDTRMAEIVKLRFFAGLTERETAHALGLSARTVRKDWMFARAFLQRELKS